MRSALYKGVVTHRRSDTVQHGFQYPLFMVYLDLDDMDRFFALSRFWSRERLNWASFFRKDYLRPETPDLKQAVIEEIKDKTGADFSGSVFMLSHLRYFGICFNPATFYYCYEQNQLKYVVIEVTNTPWQERHTYVLTCPEEGAVFNITSQKQFHVSPFMTMDMEYHWKLEAPAEQLRLYISNVQNGNMIFNAGLKLHREPASTRSLNKTLLQYPAVTLKTITGIYWQALRLWLKGAKFIDHPKSTEDNAS